MPPVLASFWHWAFRDCPSGPGGLVRVQVPGAPGLLRPRGGPGGVWTQGPGLLGNCPRFPETGPICRSGCLGCRIGVSARICPGPGPGRGSQGRGPAHRLVVFPQILLFPQLPRVGSTPKVHHSLVLCGEALGPGAAALRG